MSKPLNNKTHRACLNCGEGVHARAKACAACGAPSPWTSDDGKPPVTMQNTQGTSEPVAEAIQEKYVVLKDFKQQVGDVMIDLKKGRIITDMRLLQRLVAAGAPIVGVDQQEGIVCCPKCSHVFDAEALKARVKAEKVARAVAA